MVPATESLIPCGDWNGHISSTGSGYKEVHGGHGYGKPDPDSKGERIIESAMGMASRTLIVRVRGSWRVLWVRQAGP